MTIRNRIIAELVNIEETEDLTILLAVESGSRAWGFASPDSDYDVRFVYVRPQEYYLRLDTHRDVCEWMLDDTLDINGWDIDKTLRMLRSSNPTLFEWMNSPLIYYKHPAFDSLMGNAYEYFLSKPGLHHYLSMAKGNYRDFLQGETVKLKKYFYVLRPILACRHILRNGTPPPMLFSELMDAQLDKALIQEVTELLKMKEKASEMGCAPKIQKINDYIEESIEYLNTEINALPSSRVKKPWEPLNDIFLRALEAEGRLSTLSPNN